MTNSYKNQSNNFSENEKQLQKHGEKNGKSRKTQRLGNIKDENIPGFAKYEHIQTAYRLDVNCWKKLLKSLFYFHNETVNIWSHLIGAIVFIVVLILLLFYYEHYSESYIFSMISSFNKISENLQKFAVEGRQQLNFLPIYVLLISATICLLASAIFHTFYPLSKKVNTMLLRADYCGINVLIVGSAWAPYYYGFYCLQYYFYIYMSLIIVVNLGVIVMAFQDFTHDLKFRKIKTYIYGACGVISFLPSIHLIIYEYFQDSNIQYSSAPSLLFYSFTLISYGLGMTIYLKGWPEKIKPKKYDVCGASHQLWHMLVVAAIFFTLIGAINNYEQREQYMQCQ